MDTDKIITKDKPKPWFFVEKKLLPSKLGYFLINSCLGCYLPFINIFLTSVSLSASEAGFITGVCFISSAIAGPVWGLLIDNMRCKRLIFFIMCMGATGTIFPLPWIAREVQSSDILNCYYNGSSVNSSIGVGGNTTMATTAGCSHVLVPYQSTLFYLMLALTNIANIFVIPLAAMIDSFVMNIIKTNEIDSSFGMQRVFGSVGFGLTSFLSGVAVDHYDHPTLSKYTAIFYVFLGFMALVVPIGFVLIGQANWDNNDLLEDNKDGKAIEEGKTKLMSTNSDGETPVETGKAKLVVQVFANMTNSVFMLAVLIGGIMGNVLMGFLFLLMEVDMDASKTCMGITILVGCISEVMMFPITHKLIKFLGGPIPSLELGLLVYAVRFLSLSYIQNAWVTVPIHLLHSITFALFWASAIEYTELISSERIYGTMFGILNSIYFGCGGLIGNMAGGIIFDKFTGSALYRNSSILVGAFFVIFFIYFHGMAFMTFIKTRFMLSICRNGC